MRLVPLAVLSLLALAGCREDPPAPVGVELPAPTDTSGGGVPPPTADEIDAGIDILEEALGGDTGP